MNTTTHTSAQIVQLIDDLDAAIGATERRINYLTTPRPLSGDLNDAMAAAVAALNPDAGLAAADELRTLYARLSDQRRARMVLPARLEHQRVRERAAVDASFAGRRAALRRKTAEAGASLAACLEAEDALDLERRIAGGNGHGVAEFCGSNAGMLRGWSEMVLRDLADASRQVSAPAAPPAPAQPRQRLRKLSDLTEGEAGIVA